MRNMRVAFVCISLVLTTFITEWINSGFGFLVPEITRRFATTTVSGFWPAIVFSLSNCATTISWSRAVDKFGAARVYLTSLLWLAMWCLIAGFSKSLTLFCISRGMQGLAIGALVPAQYLMISEISATSSLAQKNLLSWCTAFSPVGFLAGNLIAACSPSYLDWPWFFWISGLVVATNLVLALVSVPWRASSTKAESGHDNWCGSILLTTSLLLLAYALAVSPSYKSSSLHVIGPTIVGLVSLLLTVWHECYFTDYPLLPRSLFAIAHINMVMIACTLYYTSASIYVYYFVFYSQETAGLSRVAAALWWTPACIVGFCLAKAVGYASQIPKRGLLSFFAGLSNVGWVVAPLLLIVIPQHTSATLPCIVLSTVLSICGFDITFTRSTILLTESQPPYRHGLVGCLSTVFIELGTAFGLALANIVQQKANRVLHLTTTYAPAFSLAIVFASCGLISSLISCYLETRALHAQSTMDLTTESTSTCVRVVAEDLSPPSQIPIQRPAPQKDDNSSRTRSGDFHFAE